MKKVFFTLPILFIYICVATPLFAQTTPTPQQQFLEVSPVIEDIQLTPGEKTTYPLSITNRGDKPVGFHIEATGIDPTNDGIISQATLKSPLLSWISVNPTDIIVPPHGKNSFTVSINTPKNTLPSGYYATLFLTPFISNPLVPHGPIILERIGTLLLTTVGNLNYAELAKKVHITNFTYQPKQITFSVQNSYFTHFTAKPFLSYVSLVDHQTRFFPEEKHVLPGSSRLWTIPIRTPWYTLYRQVDLAVSIGDGRQLSAQITYINYPLIFGIVLCTCFLLLIFKRTKQLKSAITILFTGHK